jgi:hypothetical protein
MLQCGKWNKLAKIFDDKIGTALKPFMKMSANFAQTTFYSFFKVSGDSNLNKIEQMMGGTVKPAIEARKEVMEGGKKCVELMWIWM